MDSRSNVIAMMVLGAGIVALGSSIVAGEVFDNERPEKMGYIVEGVEDTAGGEAPAVVVPIASMMAPAIGSSEAASEISPTRSPASPWITAAGVPPAVASGIPSGGRSGTPDRSLPRSCTETTDRAEERS